MVEFQGKQVQIVEFIGKVLIPCSKVGKITYLIAGMACIQADAKPKGFLRIVGYLVGCPIPAIQGGKIPGWAIYRNTTPLL